MSFAVATLVEAPIFGSIAAVGQTVTNAHLQQLRPQSVTVAALVSDQTIAHSQDTQQLFGGSFDIGSRTTLQGQGDRTAVEIYNRTEFGIESALGVAGLQTEPMARLPAPCIGSRGGPSV